MLVDPVELCDFRVLGQNRARRLVRETTQEVASEVVGLGLDIVVRSQRVWPTDVLPLHSGNTKCGEDGVLPRLHSCVVSIASHTLDNTNNRRWAVHTHESVSTIT